MSQSFAQEFPRRGTAIFLNKNVDIGPQCCCMSYCHWSSHPLMTYSTSVQGCRLLEPLGEMQSPEATSLSRAIHNCWHIHRAAQDYLPTELQAHPSSYLQYTISVYRWQVSLFSNSSNHSVADLFKLKWTCSVLYVSQSVIECPILIYFLLCFFWSFI